MEMKLEVGKAYRTREGKRIIAKIDDLGDDMPIYCDNDCWYERDGRINTDDRELDIIAEWIDEPSPCCKIGKVTPKDSTTQQVKINNDLVDVPSLPETKTLRDEFAMAVAPAILVQISNTYRRDKKFVTEQQVEAETAKLSFRLADAMLKARQVKS